MPGTKLFTPSFCDMRNTHSIALALNVTSSMSVRLFHTDSALGAEMRCDVDGEMFGTKVGRNLHELLDASDAWKAAFEAKGWSA